MSPPTIERIYEDQDILVVNKPHGIGTQAPREFDSLEARVRAYLEATSSEPHPYLGIPHRLDRCASGTIVFAKRRKAAQRLSKQFELREVTKIYSAKVAGVVEPAAGEWEDYLRKVPDEPRAEVVGNDHAEGKWALLRYQVQSQDESTSQLRIELATGRMHQIRIQCAARNHPVLGDETYGSTVAFGPACEHPRERWIALHATELAFEHPRAKEQMTFTSPFPEHW